MAQADANRVELTILEEASGSYGTTPVTGAPEIIRYTSEDLAPTTEFAASDEIESSLMIPDNILVSVGGGGSVNFEAAYGAHDTLYAATLNSSGWSSPASATTAGGTTITADVSGGDNTLALSTGNWNDGSNFNGAAAVGMWIHVAGYAGAVNNGYFRINGGVGTATLTLAGISTMTNEALTADNLTITLLGQIANGTAFRSFTVQREYKNLSNIFARCRGTVFTGLDLSWTAREKVSGSFRTLFKDATSNASAMGDSASARPSGDPNGTNKVYSSVADAKGLIVTGLGGSAQAKTRFRSFTARVSKGDQGIEEATETGFVDIVQGGFTVEGDLEVYFEDNSLFTDFTNTTEKSFHLIYEDASSQGYVFSVDRANLVSATRNAGGKDQPVIATFGWRSAKDGTTSTMVRMARKA